MNAKHINAAYRSLYMNGGRLLALFAETERQFTEARAEQEELKKWKSLARPVAECPCGCGLKNDICDAQAERVKMANEDLPF